MKRTATLIVALGLLAAPLAAVGQQPTKVPRIGVLSNVRASDAGPRDEAFRQGLREKSWVDGQNVVIEYRYADNELGRLPALAADLIRLGVDVIVAPSTPAAEAASHATATIPIVFVTAADPVGSDSLTASPAQAGTSPDWPCSPVRKSPASTSSCSRKSSPGSPAWRCCGTPRAPITHSS